MTRARIARRVKNTLDETEPGSIEICFV